MAIALTKTLQAVEYNLYIVTSIRLVLTIPTVVQVSQDIYQSAGHYTDDFTPMIHKDIDITSSDAVVAITALLSSNYSAAVTAAEQYLIGAVAYYSGGEIVA